MYQSKHNKEKEEIIDESKIAVITKPKEVKYIPYSYNSLGPDEVLIKVLGCGLDHSDVLLWEGRDWINYPLPSGVPGREGWGIIEEAGEHCRFSKGDTVAILAANALSNKVICKNDEVRKIPDTFQNRLFPAKAFAYALNIYNKINISADDVVVVLGNGFVSSILCYLIKQAGATTFKVANGGADSNANETYTWHSLNKLKEKTYSVTEGAGADIIFECTGTLPACDLATNLLKEEGKLILARKSKAKTVSINLEDPCGLDIIIAYDQELNDLYMGIDKAVELIGQEKLIPEDFISKTYPFEKLQAALNDLCRDTGEYNKACILFKRN